MEAKAKTHTKPWKKNNDKDTSLMRISTKITREQHSYKSKGFCEKRKRKEGRRIHTIGFREYSSHCSLSSIILGSRCKPLLQKRARRFQYRQSTNGPQVSALSPGCFSSSCSLWWPFSNMIASADSNRVGFSKKIMRLQVSLYQIQLKQLTQNLE